VTVDDGDSEAPGRSPWVILSVLCLGFFMILLDTTIVNVAIPSMSAGLNTTLDQILWVLNAYILVYAVCVVAFIPASILTLGAGAIFGFVGGTIVVVIGAMLASTVSFLLARTVMRKHVEAMTAKSAKFRALDRAIASEGMKIVFLVRLAVVFPFTYINYAFGLTAIPLWRYVVATFFGIIPVTAAFVFASSSATNAATTSTSWIMKTIYIAGAVIAIIVSVLIGRIATKAIKRAGVEE